MTARVIHRYEVPVDGQWHTLRLSGPVYHVASRRSDVVEVWALHTGGPVLDRRMRVYGTGQSLQDGLLHVATAIIGPFVWHLMESRHVPYL